MGACSASPPTLDSGPQISADMANICRPHQSKKTGRSVKLAVSGDIMGMQIFLHGTYSVPSAKPHDGRQQLQHLPHLVCLQTCWRTLVLRSTDPHHISLSLDS